MYQPFATSDAQDAVLDRIAALAHARTGVAILDIDGCLLDTRYRQLAILRAFAERHGVWELARVEVHHFEDRDMARTLVRSGVDPRRARLLARSFRPFWLDHFFRPELTAMDHPLPGAARFCHGLQDAGLDLVYLTGRVDDCRAVTLEAFRRFGFPGAEEGRLVTKSDPSQADAAYKAEALDGIAARGPVTLAVDNEPENLRVFGERFPDAQLLWVHTDHGSAFEPEATVPRVSGFLRQGDLAV